MAVDVTFFSLGFCYSLFEMGVHAQPFRFQNFERIEGIGGGECWPARHPVANDVVLLCREA